ncbi:S24 family peptidase [Achromobacter xylosoxidans]
MLADTGGASRADDGAGGDLRIPRFDTGGAMGAGVELRDQPGVIQSLRVSQEWLHKNLRHYTAAANLCVVTGFGDSMRPMYNPGDPLLVDLGVVKADVDGVFFFRVGNEGFIKRLQRIPSARGLLIRAKSENTKYDAWDITEDMDLQIFGRVLKVWRSEDL